MSVSFYAHMPYFSSHSLKSLMAGGEDELRVPFYISPCPLGMSIAEGGR